MPKQQPTLEKAYATSTQKFSKAVQAFKKTNIRIAKKIHMSIENKKTQSIRTKIDTI